MKKLLVTLIVLAILSVMMVPAMATETAAVKDYASAAEGELLYTVDFSGKDNVITYGSIGGTNATKYFSYTPSDDGKSLTVKGAQDKGQAGTLWGGTIPSLEANMDTVYTMTYKVKSNGAVGTNNSVGVGGYYMNKIIDDTASVYNLYGNYTTKGDGDDISMRRSALSFNNTKISSYVMWNTLPAYEVDAEGFVTAMITFDGPSMMMTAYLKAENAGDGSAASDWVKVEEQVLVPTNSDCMGFVVYAYYITDVDSVIKDVNIYKGKIFAEPVVPETEPPTEAPTTAPTTEPTQAPTQATDPSDNNAQEPGSPVGIIIGIVAAVVVVAAVVIVIIKKKKNA